MFPETEHPQEAKRVYPGKHARTAQADPDRYFTQSPRRMCIIKVKVSDKYISRKRRSGSCSYSRLGNQKCYHAVFKRQIRSRYWSELIDLFELHVFAIESTTIIKVVLWLGGSLIVS